MKVSSTEAERVERKMRGLDEGGAGDRPAPSAPLVESGIDEHGEITCASCVTLTSEIGEAKATINRLEAEVSGLERDVRGWAFRYRELERDKEAEAREHELWNVGMDLFDLWKAAAGQAEGRSKARAKFSAARFYLMLPMMKTDGEEICQRAIIGRCFDHYGSDGKLARKNGTPIHYCELERIFKDRKEFEESVRRCPSDWRERVKRFS